MNHNASHTPAVSRTEIQHETAEDNDDLMAVMDDLRDFWDEDVGDEDDQCDDESAYERTITVEFPPECSRYPGAQSATISIRDLLSWYAELGPVNDREKAKQIRDAFYAGDHEDDYEIGFFHTAGAWTPEERALVRWDLEQGQAERQRRKAEFDAGDQQYQSNEERLWQPFLAEKAAIDAEEEAQWDRADALDREWYEFVSRIKSGEKLSDDWIARRRAELQAETAQLIADQNKTAEAYCELRFKASKYLERNESG